MKNKKDNASKEAKDYLFCVLYNHQIIIGGTTDAERIKYADLKEWYKNLTMNQRRKFNKELY